MRTAEAIRTIDALPQSKEFFRSVMHVASKAGLRLIERAAARAFTAFKELPDTYFDEKRVETYRFHATFPNYGLLQHSREGDWDRIAESLSSAKEVSLYYHVPYCARKCHYCSFPSHAIRNIGKGTAASYSEYFQTVWQEKKLLDTSLNLPGKAVVSIYFGGGTPTALPAEVLKEALRRGKEVNLVEGGQITCEASPGTLTEEKLAVIAEGASRLSIGVQTFDDGLLRFIGRDHDAARAESAVRQALECLDHVNVDLIYSLPGQSIGQWLETLEKTVALSPDSVTIYRYWSRQDSTWFGKDMHFPHEMAARLMYFLGIGVLEENGYSLGPLHWLVKGVRNKEYENRWGKGIPNVGLGVGGYGSSRDFVFRKTRDIGEYIESIGKGAIPLKEALMFDSKMNEASSIIGQLRAYHETLLPTGMGAVLSETTEMWIRQGLAEKGEGKLFLTDAGKALFDWMETELESRLFSIGSG